MQERFLIDTAIWVDFYEDRKGYQGEPLGYFAHSPIARIITTQFKIIITELLIEELQRIYSPEQIESMLKPFENILERIPISNEQYEETKLIAKNRKAPKGDALYAVIARDNRLTLITRDKHFKKLKDIAPHYKPGYII